MDELDYSPITGRPLGEGDRRWWDRGPRWWGGAELSMATPLLYDVMTSYDELDQVRRAKHEMLRPFQPRPMVGPRFPGVR